METIENVMRSDLDIISKYIFVGHILKHDVEFKKTHPGKSREVELDAQAAGNNVANEVLRLDVGHRVEIVETDDLHVRVANGAA